MAKAIKTAGKAAIKWKLVELDKAVIRPNPNNPKLKDEKGSHQLDLIMEKFGVIYDGIINADYSLIDGHSRLEKRPTGLGNYFMPDKLLSQNDEKELNALFDLARAGKPDMFMIEQILGDEFITEWETDLKKQKKIKKEDKNVKYPLVPVYDEKYEAIVILCSASIDTTFIKNALGISKAMSYKNKVVKETSIITAKQFIEAWKQRSK